MANELTRPASFAPTTFADAMAFCKMLAQTSFVPSVFKGKPDEILAAVQFGAELGVGPMQALQNIAVINGKPSVYGDLALALVHASGHLDYIEENDDGAVATCEVKRKGDKNPHIVTFSNDDARRAGLLSKAGTWQQYPARMRMWRARGFALRDKFPDVLKGLITREEAMDYPVESGVVQQAKTADFESVNAGSTPAPGTTVLEVAAEPTDKASKEQRQSLVKMARQVLGGKDQGDDWLKARVSSKEITLAEFQDLTQKLVDIRAQDDAVVESFDAEQLKQAPDIDF